MLHETIVPQQVDAVGRAHIEIYVLQIEQSGKPHTSFNVPSLDTPSQIYII